MVLLTLRQIGTTINRVCIVMDQQSMLTIDEVEREFALKRSTLYNYVRMNLITPYKRVGDRRSYFKQSEIENLVQFQPRKNVRDKEQN